jgi:hypothetical protein
MAGPPLTIVLAATLEVGQVAEECSVAALLFGVSSTLTHKP